MKVTVVMKGTLRKRYGTEERIVELPEGSSCDDALKAIGIDYRNEKYFGFVSVNSLRVMIDSPLHDGDYLKAFSRVSGG